MMDVVTEFHISNTTSDPYLSTYGPTLCS